MGSEDKKLVNMEGLETALTEFKTQMFLAVYPIGSIYMSINETAPGTLFGGTWQRIEDTFLLSAGQTYEAGAAGGNALTTLLEANLPSHSHSISINTNTADCSSLTLTGTAASAGSHNHTFSEGEAAEAGSHSHTFNNGAAASAGAHGHTFTGTAVYTDYQLDTHTHTFTTSKDTHSHTYNNDQYNGVNIQSVSTSVSKGSEGTANTYAPAPHGDGNGLSYVKLDGGTQYYSSKSTTSIYQETLLYADLMGSTAQDTHNHTGTTDPSSSLSHRHIVTAAGAISNTDGAHTHTVTGTISSNGAHTHTVTGTIENAGTHTHDVEVSGGDHNHSISYTGDTGDTGSGISFSNMPPYLAVYTWKRIA